MSTNINQKHFKAFKSNLSNENQPESVLLAEVHIPSRCDDDLLRLLEEHGALEVRDLIRKPRAGGTTAGPASFGGQQGNTSLRSLGGRLGGGSKSLLQYFLIHFEYIYICIYMCKNMSNNVCKETYKRGIYLKSVWTRFPTEAFRWSRGGRAFARSDSPAPAGSLAGAESSSTSRLRHGSERVP